MNGVSNKLLLLLLLVLSQVYHMYFHTNCNFSRCVTRSLHEMFYLWSPDVSPVHYKKCFLRSLNFAYRNIPLSPQCFLRCVARKQKQLQVLQIPVTAAGENILFIIKMFWLLRSFVALPNKIRVTPRCFTYTCNCCGRKYFIHNKKCFGYWANFAE